MKQTAAHFIAGVHGSHPRFLSTFLFRLPCLLEFKLSVRGFQWRSIIWTAFCAEIAVIAWRTGADVLVRGLGLRAVP